MKVLRRCASPAAVVVSAALLALLASADVASATSAQFERRSYRAGETAVLNVASTSGTLTVQVFRVGREATGTPSDPVIWGVPVTDPMRVRRRGTATPTPL